MATKLRNATKCRDVPEPEVASRFALEHRARSIVSIMAGSSAAVRRNYITNFTLAARPCLHASAS
jgi:hypothetical protein